MLFPSPIKPHLPAGTKGVAAEIGERGELARGVVQTLLKRMLMTADGVILDFWKFCIQQEPTPAANVSRTAPPSTATIK